MKVTHIKILTFFNKPSFGAMVDLSQLKYPLRQFQKPNLYEGRFSCRAVVLDYWFQFFCFIVVFPLSLI